MSSYRDLDIYKVSLDLFVRVHQFSFKLPKYETYELDSQLRRSADSVNSNIVEGYGRKTYKNDYIRFLVFSNSSNDETVNHLKKINLLYPSLSIEVIQLIKEYEILGRRIYSYIEYVRKNWK